MFEFRSSLGKVLVPVLFLFITACSEEPTAADIVDSGEEFISLDDAEVIAEYLTIDLENLDNYSNYDRPDFFEDIFNDLDNTPLDNEVTDEGATLGRVLFYDSRLSINNTISCSSCHKSEKGFSDGEQFSEGFDGGLTERHAMRLINTRYYQPGTMFWDKSAETLEAQTTVPMQHPLEMGFDGSVGGMDSLVNKMAQIPYYPILFNFVFGDSLITEERIQLALAQFIRSIESYQSRFDEGYAEVYDATAPDGNVSADFSNFTENENYGKYLFVTPADLGGGGCAECHMVPTFTLIADSKNNGYSSADNISKAPSLRNSAQDENYMHDGVYGSLGIAVSHYTEWVQDNPNLDDRLRNPDGTVRQLFWIAEIGAVVEFLETLTDYTLSSNVAFSDPFIE